MSYGDLIDVTGDFDYVGGFVTWAIDAFSAKLRVVDHFLIEVVF